MARDPIFTVDDLRGGVNTTDSPTLLKSNQVVAAVNVDFRDGALGAKRRGTKGISVAGSTLTAPIAALIRHTPSNAVGNDELWGIDEDGHIDRRVGGTWAGGVSAVNTHVVVNASNFNANGASLHGKLFIAAHGTRDRLLVWDGTRLRWAGLAQPPDPTVADTGAGTFSGTRYYRIRYVERNTADTATLRRSEPTTTVSLAPAGTGSGALITKPAGTEANTSAYNEGQTHWEVEASLDNILFYRIARVAIATGTYTDTTAAVAGYATFPLSEAIGEYVPPGSARLVAVDEDRVVMAGSFFEPADDSKVWWTPVAADDGVGNDERIPTATSQYISFDGLDGGRVTALAAGVTGNVYVFKYRRIYKMVRTGVVESAYQPITESFGRGATFRGAAAGSDQAGVPCAYFVDPSVGLCRIGQRGVEDLAQQIRDTWSGLNPDAIISPRIIYYPDLDQVWYTNPTGVGEVLRSAEGEAVLSSTGEEVRCGLTLPENLIVYDTRTGGLVFFDGVPGSAYALSLLYEGTALKPIIGTEFTDIGGGNTSTIHLGDTGATDGGTAYRAYIKTKPYVLGNLWSKFGLMAAVLFARAQSSGFVTVKIIRNMGVEESAATTVSLVPVGSESHVVRPLDNATMSELNTVQIELGDVAPTAQVWSLDQIVFRVRPEDASA